MSSIRAKLAVTGLIAILFWLNSGFSIAKTEIVPTPDFDLTLPLYLGTLDQAGQRAVVLYLHFDKKGLTETCYVPVRLNQGQLQALPPQERALGMAEIVARFGSNAQAVFWNGLEWQTAQALAYQREASLNTTRTVQVHDLSGESGGYSTGQGDFAKDNQIDERLQLANGSLKVWRPLPGGQWQSVWESTAGWQVLQFSFGDADEDGRPEIIFSLWKNDGPDDRGQFRSHPFVYGWRRGEIRPVWAGSALVDPIREFALSNFAQSGNGPQNQLIVLEGSYADPRDTPAHALTVWQWNGWGYELLWRGPPGRYAALHYVPDQPFAFFSSQ